MMKKLIPGLLFFVLLASCYSQKQTVLTMQQVDSLLVPPRAPVKYSGLDSQIIDVVQAIDRQFYTICDTLYSYHGKKYTLVQPVMINIRFLMPAREAIIRYKPDSATWASYSRNGIRDTSWLLDQVYDERSDSMYAYGLYPVDSLRSNPLLVERALENRHLIFNTPKLIKQTDSLKKRKSRLWKEQLHAHLHEHYDYYWKEKKKFDTKAIRIRYIVFGREKDAYAGIDIYGAHFLWKMNMQQQGRVVGVERLWVY
jgi:hypothetical protein